jgi:hypothetical protein
MSKDIRAIRRIFRTIAPVLTRRQRQVEAREQHFEFVLASVYNFSPERLAKVRAREAADIAYATWAKAMA